MSEAATVEPTMIAIKDLVPSRRQVRKTKATAEEDKQLLAGIRAHGLLHNLTVVPASKKGKFEVIAGGRRLKALKVLVKQGHYDATQTVPCVVRDPNDPLEELGTMENAQRASMHPADEFEAFHKMEKQGATVETIAATFGVTKRTVQQRLKLATLHKDILQAYRKGEINLDVCQVFTIEADQAKQLEVYEALNKDSDFGIRSHQVRHALTNQAVRSDNKIAKFVGRAAYKKAGGTIHTDLFQSEEYFDDAQLLNSLAVEKLQAFREERADGHGWCWTEIAIDKPDLHAMRRLDPVETDESRKVQEEYDATAKKLDTLEEKQEEEWTERDDQHYQRLEDALASLEIKREGLLDYDPKQKALAGAVFYIAFDGSVGIDAGIVRKSELKAFNELIAGKLREPGSKSKSGAASNSKSTESSGATESEDPGEDYSEALCSELIISRNTIAKVALAKQPELAQDLLFFTVCMSQLTNTYSQDALALRTETTYHIDGRSKGDNDPALEALFELRNGLNFDWMKVDDDTERFRRFRELPSDQKSALMAISVACTLRGSLNRNGGMYQTNRHDFVECIYSLLPITWSEYWRPTASNLLGRLKKGTVISFGKPFLDEHWAEEAAGRSRKDIAIELEDVFAGKDPRTEGKTDKNDQDAASWVPTVFHTPKP